MKKLLSMILALVMVLSMGTVVFADTTITQDENGNWQNNEPTQPVDVVVSVNSSVVYNVTISWNSLTFTYQIGNDMEWSVTDHKYVTKENSTGETTTTGWNKTGNQIELKTDATDTSKVTGLQSNIEVINHSNAEVTVTASYADGTNNDVDGVTDTFGVVTTTDGTDVFATNGANDVKTLKSAAEVAVEKPSDLGLGNSVVYAVQVTGSPITPAAQSANVGKITITISIPSTEEPTT